MPGGSRARPSNSAVLRFGFFGPAVVARSWVVLQVRIDPDDPSTLPEGRIDPARVDATTEGEIAAQEREDEDEAMQDMARYARRVRRRARSLSDRIGHGAPTCRSRRSATGNRASAAPPALHAPCCACLTRLPRPRSAS